MAIKTKNNVVKREIDLDGPSGNAYVLLGIAQDWAKQLDYSEEERVVLHEDMTSSDYEHLIQVFDKHFGSFCDLIRSSSEEDEDED